MHFTLNKRATDATLGRMICLESKHAIGGFNGFNTDFEYTKSAGINSFGIISYQQTIKKKSL
jgi:hypothetical protein